MEFAKEDHDLILSYLLGDLEASKMEEVEQRMRSDEMFRKEVSLLKTLPFVTKNEGWPDLDHKNDKAEIEELIALRRSQDVIGFETKIKKGADLYFRKQKKKKSLWKTISGVAAVAVIMLIVFRSFVFNEMSHQELYAAYVNWENDLVSVTEQSTEIDLYTQGEVWFKKGEYQKALRVFLKLKEQKKESDSYVLMYLGASYLELEEYDLALKAFDELQQQRDLDSNRAYWYKVLVYLKQGDKKLAIDELHKLIENPTNFNYNKAKELLKKLQ